MAFPQVKPVSIYEAYNRGVDVARTRQAQDEMMSMKQEERGRARREEAFKLTKQIAASLDPDSPTLQKDIINTFNTQLLPGFTEIFGGNQPLAHRFMATHFSPPTEENLPRYREAIRNARIEGGYEAKPTAGTPLKPDWKKVKDEDSSTGWSYQDANDQSRVLQNAPGEKEEKQTEYEAPQEITVGGEIVGYGQRRKDTGEIRMLKTKQPTTLEQNLEAAGLKPGSLDYQKTALETIKKTPKTEVINNIGPKAFQKLGEEMSVQLIGRREKALEAVSSLEGISEAKNLINSGVVTGFGADFIIGFGKALKKLGIQFDTDDIANTEAYVANQAKQVGAVIKMFGAGTGLSDADREYAEKAAAGKITMTEDSIRKILDINERANRNAIRSYNKDAEQAENKAGDVLPYSLTVKEPGAGTEAKAVKRRGTDKKTGRPVVEYTDGTIEYDD